MNSLSFNLRRLAQAGSCGVDPGIALARVPIIIWEHLIRVFWDKPHFATTSMGDGLSIDRRKKRLRLISQILRQSQRVSDHRADLQSRSYDARQSSAPSQLEWSNSAAPYLVAKRCIRIRSRVAHGR
jgi:hypothetical protein